MKTPITSRTTAGVRVVHVSCAHPWTDNRIHLREAATLADAGFDVGLIAVESDSVAPSTGVHVVLLRPRKRIARAFLGSWDAFVAAVRMRARIYHLHDPQLAWTIPLFRLMGRTVVYDAHEDLPNEVRDKHYIPAWLMPLFVFLAHVIVATTRLSSHVIAATEAIALRYPGATVIHNYPRLRAADESSDSISTRAKYVVYVGNVEAVRGAIQMVSATESPEFPDDWTFLLAGKVSPENLLTRMTAMPGWSEVDYRGLVSPNAARDLIAKSRLGLVLLQRTRAYVESLPTKLFEYLAAGVPVIASDFPLWRQIIEEHDCGVVVDEASPTAIAQAIARYASSPELLQRQSANAFVAARKLNWDTEARELVHLYERLLNTSTGREQTRRNA